MFSRNVLLKATWAALSALIFSASAQSAPLDLRNVPLYLLSRANPNVLLNMSVETPMGGAAYADQAGNPTGCTGRVDNPFGGESSATGIGKCYSSATVFLGYFDPKKCYEYNSGGGYFQFSAAAVNHVCGSKWSGNFLNWATMTAIDMFIQTMTGGNRVTDTTSLTIVQRARKHDNNSWFPVKAISTALNGTAPNTVTTSGAPQLFIVNTATGFKVATTYASANSGSPDVGTFNAKVKVCDKVAGIEPNCVAYGSGASTYHKPEGLIQGNSRSKRFAVLSYTSDNTQERGGGVIRSNMKYVGPVLPDGSDNPRREYDKEGLLIHDPDAVANAGAGLYDTKLDTLNSGVINYINKFSDPGYKSHDPIGELFYEGIRYFKDLGPTPEYSGADNHVSPALTAITKNSTDARCGGFWFANTGEQWEDPIQYRCQKNFIVAINDANPWLDKRLPGTSFTTSTITPAATFTPSPLTLAAGDYGEPSNPDTDINVTTLTNRVGELEGINNTWTNSGTWSSGDYSGTNDSIGGGSGSWDNSCSTSKAVQLGEVMGTCPAPQKQNSYYVAGLAYYANTTDLRDLADDRGIQTVSSFIIDTQEFNTNPLDGPRNMLWLAGKYGGFVDRDGDRVPDGANGDHPSEWDSDGDGAPDNYVLATQPAKLIAGLNRAFEFIDSQDTSAASASVNAGSISSETRVYQAKFNSGDWTGELLSLPVNTQADEDEEEGSLADDEWSAVQMIPAHGDRKIFTVNGSGTAVPFLWANIGTTRRNQLQGLTTTEAQARLNYLRGSDAAERKNGGPYRNRNKVLGDIINSAPLFVGKPPFLYNDPSYIAFRAANDTVAERPHMVYVGANDGMLHAFNADTGIEQFAYIPGAVYRKLHLLTSPNYEHQFYVDGSPTMGDVFFSNDWHTMLVGGLNKGGQGVYALDVTDPDQANPQNMWKWEYTDATSADSADLGYTFSRPAIIKVKDGTGTAWVAAFGNGYNNTEDDTASGGQKSATGDAALYFINIATGALFRKIPVEVGTAEDPLGFGRPNGLATPAFVDLNGDSVVDFAYAGDLFGNLWKFDLRDANKDNWKIAFDAKPLFTATDDNNKVQPITSRPEVARGPNNRGMIVVFGTGKFLEPTDRDVAQLTTQSMYGIIDPNDGVAGAVGDRDDHLTEQVITEEFVGTFKTDAGTDVQVPIRVSTKNEVLNRGWYMDLLSGEPGVPEPSGFKGEMMVSDPIVRNGRLIFTTLIPNPDPCDFGGTSWLMEIDVLTGARLKETPFDLNGDGVFDNQDYVKTDDEGQIPVSGRQSEVGIIPRPGVLAGETSEYKYTPGTSGNMQVIRENPGVGDVGRQSWRQLR